MPSYPPQYSNENGRRDRSTRWPQRAKEDFRDRDDRSLRDYSSEFGDSARAYRERDFRDAAGPRFDRFFEEWERPRRMDGPGVIEETPIDDHRRGQGAFAGRGPKNYKRSDPRIQEDVCDRLTADPQIDASEIEVSVQDGEVTLDGCVDDRSIKRAAEDCIEALPGVIQVHNRLRVQSAAARERNRFSEQRDEQHPASSSQRSGSRAS
jgi:hypothetical protein